MNPLEDFILENREDLDRIEPIQEEALWNRIAKELPKETDLAVAHKKQNPWQISIGRNWLMVAAGIALAIGVGLFWINADQRRLGSEMELAQFSPELAEEQARYIALVEAKEEELGIDQLDRKIFQEVFQELETWEEIYAEYLKDLPSYQAKEEVVHTLSKYYERKIRILERLSREMEKHYQQEKRKNEKRI
ncbi:MAG: hypothetical protein KTR30_15360 [Saprospiraceae bacterium]|nr:hypothetical protein [Saprospiraceae bacterium]